MKLKLILKTFLPFAFLSATTAVAQSNNIPQVQHVIIVVQENRTPDNLFGSDLQNQPRRLPNAHLASTGYCGKNQVPLAPLQLDTCIDPDHSHDSTKFSGAWEAMYDGGLMDDACGVSINKQGCSSSYPIPSCYATHTCPYTYVNNAPIPATGYGIVEPYFQIATNYSFANWMFQTNQGPSFEAHQFLFTGTSAPTYPGDTTQCYTTGTTSYPCYQWFAAELIHQQYVNYGCVAANGMVVEDTYPGAGSINTVEYPSWAPPWDPPPDPGYPCYNHNTMADLLENNTQGTNITWRYYANVGSGTNPQGSLWTAPNAIDHICKPTLQIGGGSECTGPDWPGQNNYNGNIVLDPPQILTDLGAVAGQPCNLQQVSWVIPDGNWSDHPGTPGADAGPSWVAAIVNAVGGVDNNDNLLPNQCTDTINDQKIPYWQDTVVLITWDDWGGFYDDVLPWNCSPTVNKGNCTGYSDGSGGQYVYGFRVPLLVVSAWMTSKGYVSGPPSQAAAPYVHDFGSILNFIEYAFGERGYFLTSNNTGTTTWGISGSGAQWAAYADYLAPDAYISCTNCTYPYSLADFFNFSNPNGPQRFTWIKGAKYPTSDFLNPTGTFTTYPMDPDNDNSDN